MSRCVSFLSAASLLRKGSDLKLLQLIKLKTMQHNNEPTSIVSAALSATSLSAATCQMSMTSVQTET